jgi:hypothetical protein
MVICFKISPQASHALAELLECGDFQDQSDALNAALVNYGVIHNQVAKEGSPLKFVSFTDKTGPASELDLSNSTGNHHLLHQLARAEFPESCLSAIQPVSQAGDFSYPGRWMFGQMNRFLPVKVTCRALANLLKESPAGLEFEAAQDLILEAAVKFTTFLNACDERSGAKGDEKFSLGFPAKEKGNEKSKLRFATQFIGTIDSQGQMFGMPKNLGFVDPQKNGPKFHVTLTEPGLEFALLPNPLIDREETESGKYSQEETQFLLEHILSHVPEEAVAYKLLLSAIREGFNTPDRVDQFLLSRKGSQPEMSPAYLSTQRSGVISRMVDIGLIYRKKDGTRVSYVPTKTAEAIQ